MGSHMLLDLSSLDIVDIEDILITLLKCAASNMALNSVFGPVVLQLVVF